MLEWFGNPENWETLLSWTTLLTLIIFLWAMLGAVVTGIERYPPRRERPYDEVVAGRKVWAVAFILLSLCVWSAYRLCILQVSAIPLSPIALPVEAVRLWAGLYLVWAFQPGRD